MLAMDKILRSLAASAALPSLLSLLLFAACTQPAVEGGGKGKGKPGSEKLDGSAGQGRDFGLPVTEPPERPPCTPIKCSLGPYCGEIGDGCGNSLTCGECPPGLTCGGGGV